MAARRYPLPKRFAAALSEPAYARLRQLAERYGLGNNYCLVVLLESLNELTDSDKLDASFRAWVRRATEGED